MFDVSQFSDVSVVGMDGELSRRNVHVFDGVLSSLASCDIHNVVLNMSELDHLDYSLVKRLADRIVEFQCDGGDIRMASASGYIRSIMQAMGLEEEVYTSVEEALLSFVGESDSDGEFI
jgi:anti-anti-sigma factor